jgi:hypothetical protein
MRELLLIAASALASASAQADESRDLVLAANEARAAAATSAPAQTHPAAATAETAGPRVFRKQASRSKTRRETDEQKARRIAAQYGISW